MSTSTHPAKPVCPVTDWEERQAWDAYAAACLHSSMGANECALWADCMIEKRRKRFPSNPPPPTENTPQ